METNAMNYATARAEKLHLELASKQANAALIALSSGGPMGMTPDSVKATPQWQSARKASDKAFNDLRAFNGWFLRTFKTEYVAERNLARVNTTTNGE